MAARNRDDLNRGYNYYQQSNKPTFDDLADRRKKKEKKEKPTPKLGLDNAVLYVNGQKISNVIGEITPEPERWRPDVETIAACMKRFTYKPNWHFMVLPARPGWGWGERDSLVSIKFEFYAENSVKDFDPWKLEYEDDLEYGWSYRDSFLPPVRHTMQPKRPVIPVGATLPVPGYLHSEHEFWLWLRRDVITYAEEHERDEWFKVDKLVPFDPHAGEKAMARQRDEDRRRRYEAELEKSEERAARRRRFYEEQAAARTGPRRFPPVADVVKHPDAVAGTSKPVVIYDEAFKMDEAMMKTLVDKTAPNLKGLAKNMFEKRA